MPSGGHRFVMPLFGGMGRKQRDCSRHIFGQFFEQFHRTVYEGIFDPGSPLADERGFRTDVLDALRELKVPNLRWPGGCFVSSYHWLEYTKRPVGSRWSNLPAKNGHEDPYGVPFWSLGNENYGFWDDLPVVNNPSPYLACMANTLVPEQRIARTRALIDASGRHHVKIAFDEWNLRAWHTPPGSSAEMIGARDLNDINSTYTMADAVFSAVFLNSCIRNGDVVGMANLAPTVNVRGPLYVHADGLVKRTTFHVMSMYANLLGPRVLDSATSSASLDTGSVDVPLVDAIATGGDDGRLAVGLVNKSDGRAGGVRIRIGGIPVSGRHRAVVLTGATPDSYNDVQDPDAVRPVETDLEFVDGVAEIPAHSVVVCTIDAAAASDADAFPWGCGPVGTWTKAPNA